MSVDAPSWLVTWLEGVSVWDAVLWVVGAVALIVFIQKKGWRSVLAFARAILATAEVIDHVRELPTFIARTDETHGQIQATLAEQDLKIAEIHHEVNYNNGSSVKDGVARVEAGVKGLYDEIESLRQADADMRADFENTQNPDAE